ncbi:MAG: VIT and VWA domain-containing protein [Planctomycetota bacterium]
MLLPEALLPATVLAGTALAPLAAAAPSPAPQVAHAGRGWSANVVLPQARAFHVERARPAVEITAVSAKVVLVDGVATTTLLVDLANRGGAATEAELLLPVPDGAVVSGFEFQGAAATSTAEVLPRADAVATYESIVARLKDPALLEFAGAAAVRSSVFPVEAGGTQRVRVVYEHVLPVEGERWDYALPRSESLAATVPWSVDVEVRSQAPLADVYSPSHDLEVVSRAPHRIVLRSRGTLGAGSLRLSVLQADGPVATTLFTSADPSGSGGWFLLLAGVGEAPDPDDLPPREVTIVLDRSGSMAGEKFDQAVAAARQVLEGLEYGEAVRIVDYAADVESFSPAPVVKTRANIGALRAYLDGLTANGGTHLDGALQEALSAPPTEGFLPVVLFVTDGLPTEGETREHVIRDRAEVANVHGRRVFTFGVGHDVNASLLDAVATRSRARATYVAPGSDVEVAIGGVFEDLSGPVVTDLAFAALDADGEPHARLVRDVYPAVLPDLFRDDRLLLLGRYASAEQGTLLLEGAGPDGPMEIRLEYEFADAKPRNGFVRRLWAMRRIAALEDELRQRGADPSALAALKDDPKLGEIASEMIALATEHGVLTDSTAFLALEGTALGDETALLASANEAALENGGRRSGVDAVACQRNVGINRDQAWVNCANTLYDASGQLVDARTVQTMQGRTFFRRGARWIDGRLARGGVAAAAGPDRVVTFGSPEHLALVAELVANGCSGHLALDGEILLEVGGETILVQPEERTADAADAVEGDAEGDTED